MNSSPQHRTGRRLLRGAGQGRKGAEIAQYLLDVRGQLRNAAFDRPRKCGDLPALGEVIQTLQHSSQGLEDARRVEREFLAVCELSGDFARASPGAEGHTLGRTRSDPEWRHQRTTQRPDFGELVQ